jgi:hypothetical protein
MTAILDALGSHVYPEPTSVEDTKSNCGGNSYRVVCNKTSTDPFVAGLIANVDKVLTHGPTCLYGSTTGHANTSVVALENTTITNVHNVLFTGASGHIVDADPLPPVAHHQDQYGSFAMMTVEMSAGSAKTGIIAVSGASPYGDYQPMYDGIYKAKILNGYNLVKQTIDWAMILAPTLTTPTTTTTSVAPADYTPLYIGIGAVAVVAILALVYFMRKK